MTPVVIYALELFMRLVPVLTAVGLLLIVWGAANYVYAKMKRNTRFYAKGKNKMIAGALLLVCTTVVWAAISYYSIPRCEVPTDAPPGTSMPC